MAYYPRPVIDETVFPTAQEDQTLFPGATSFDLLTAIRLIKEKWNRFFPKLDYFNITLEPTPIVDSSTIIGAEGTTQIDPLYGEAVDPSMTKWTQPHLSGTLAVAQVEVYSDTVQVPIQFKKEAEDDELHRWGFDENWDVIATIPLGILDDVGIVMRPGDKFFWDGMPFRVLQWSFEGRWKNTNIPLFAVASCKINREGS